MKGRIVDYRLTQGGHGLLILDISSDFRNQYDKLHDSDIDISIKKYSEPRTLRANAYLWCLINEIANTVPGATNDDIYVDMLKKYGQVGSVSVQAKFAEQFERANKYHEYLGESELNGKMWKHYKLFVGSHEYSKHEFAILLDGVVQEAKDLGIETKTPEEIKSLMEARNADGKSKEKP